MLAEFAVSFWVYLFTFMQRYTDSSKAQVNIVMSNMLYVIVALFVLFVHNTANKIYSVILDFE